jgi:hypothetical protein
MKRIKERGFPNDLGKTFVPSKNKTRNRFTMLKDEDDEVLGKFDSFDDCQRAKRRSDEPDKLRCEGAWRTTISREK